MMKVQVQSIVALISVLLLIEQCNAIWCYRCTSATPGCAENFHWRGIGYWGEQCPEDNDICVKVTERKGASVTIIRDCLSTLSSGYRTDLPADRYEGCRPASKDVRLGHYVFNNTIKELDIRRDHFDSTTFCYCFLDHRCNGSTSISASIWSYSIGIAIALITASRLF
ncbi:uncharacterized protein LOC116340260 [Contarinia nasturtii]|uniref:uncharacterized protein LOC116340260 n=1 Tax=Contarinia nasturtii TaxID=265458 RepID=UPI0012D466B0|nr:uncharacterized protein LOC116340260 [Contarinia nasturtii]